MRSIFFSLCLICASIFPAFGRQDFDDLYQKLQKDFDSKPYFFNYAINDFRDGQESPFIRPYFKEYARNNAYPLTPDQLKRLPDGRFLDREIFHLAMAGRERLLNAKKIKNHPLLAVVDFSRHSSERRLFIMDIVKGQVLINTYTSHAGNSDTNRDGYPETFSNVSKSETSSLGFMSTDVTYHGQWGYSLRLKGHDPALNSNVYSRAIVFHGVGGMGPNEAAWGGISTSQGCFMISTSESGRFWGMEDKSMLDIVIDTLKKGALVFTYFDEGEDIFKSTWIKKTDIPEEPIEAPEEEEQVDEPQVPEETKPEGIKPEVTKPSETQPQAEKPEVQTPEVTTPKPSTPVEIEYSEEFEEGEQVSHLPGRGVILDARPFQGR